MSYQERENQHGCPVCRSPANVYDHMSMSEIRCSRCGDFGIDRAAHDDYTPIASDDARALASHLIKKLQGKHRPILDSQFFARLANHRLPSPSELSDNLLMVIDQRVNGRPGAPVSIQYSTDLPLHASIGAVDGGDALWAVRNLEAEQLVKGTWTAHFSNGHITATGWKRIEELKRAHVSSRYAFFARKFDNDALDEVYNGCLKPAVKQTGYDLLPVTQKAGHIDAIIEDEIRRCRFLIADLSDGNAGAYWEAGFAEGLGKPVIYICRHDLKNTHFDTDHRHTVRWNLNALDDTARKLKAVIRNTLLGRCKTGGRLITPPGSGSSCPDTGSPRIALQHVTQRLARRAPRNGNIEISTSGHALARA